MTRHGGGDRANLRASSVSAVQGRIVSAMYRSPVRCLGEPPTTGLRRRVAQSEVDQAGVGVFIEDERAEWNVRLTGVADGRWSSC